VCMFVGDTPAGQFQVLKTSQELPGGGFGPVTALSNQAFNSATGKLCGDTLHFSAFFPAAQALPSLVTVPKAHLMGGACPNSCTGHGFCRQEGKCACFAGYTGYDCSIRSCPSGASWGEVALGVNNAPVHADSECSGRGVCDRTSALCACFTGYEGAACERQACPNKCSGNGKCRFLSELPSAAGYSSWEARRVQKCVCDGGFTGADCSQRTCPYGDDPETICSQVTNRRQVQTVRLSYPTTGTLDPGSGPDYQNNELALVFTSVEGKTFTTPAIRPSGGLAASTAPAAVAKALGSLPEFAVSGVTVTAATQSSTDLSFQVTFTGATNTGNEKLLKCAFNADGYSLGCPAKGCQPLFAQPRRFKYSAPVGFTVNQNTVLKQGPGTVVSGEWGMETTLTIAPSGSGFAYTFTGTKSWTTAVDSANVNWTPVPPASSAARQGVVGPFGLLIYFADSISLTSAQSFTFYWTLPSCTVTSTQSADVDIEKAECSNRGVCDRTSGKCECFDGYSGSTCNAQVIVV